MGRLEIDRIHGMRDAGCRKKPLGLRLNENLARDDGIKGPHLRVPKKVVGTRDLPYLKSRIRDHKANCGETRD